VQRYAAGDIAQLDRGLAAVADVEGAGPRLVAFIEHFEDEADDLMAEQSSCLYVAALTERELIDTGTTAPIEKVVLAWRSAIAAMVGDALSEKGIAAPEVDVDALADHVFVTFEGAFILCRATNDPSHMRRQLGALRVLVDGLLG
jgi:TetR/AcrR family transcriptional repressor of nem operon